MKKKNIYFFIGTNAELIKIAPIMRELERRNITYRLISSGQNHIHFEGLKGFIKKQQFDLIFSEKLNKSSIFHFLLWIVKTVCLGVFLIKKEFKNVDKKNSYFIIHGDTVTSLLGAFLAKIYGIPLVHIESGCFSHNFFEPFPEEICRTINSYLANILFPPTDWAANNLKKRKGIIISTKQNTIIETFWWGMSMKQKKIKKMIPNKYYVLFMHRQEHVLMKRDWTKKLMNFVIQNTDNNMICILFNHPLIVKLLKSLDLGEKEKNIKIIPLLTYSNFLSLLNDAEFLISDSATIQQETYYMGKPMLALRNYTEQIEGVDQNYVLSKGNENVIKDFLKNYKKYQTKPIKITKKPSEIIVDYLLTN